MPDTGDQSHAQAVELRHRPHLAGRPRHRHSTLRQYGRALSPQFPWSPVPLHRRWMSDVVHFGKKSHVVAGNWTINVSPVAVARKLRRPPIGWGAIWVKAVALACRK